MNLFKKKKYITISPASAAPKTAADAPSVPDGTWMLCPHCKKTVYKKLIPEHKICPSCKNYFRLSARERIELTADGGTFVEINDGLETENVLDFQGYGEKVEKLKAALDVNEAVVSGECSIGGNRAVLCVMDSRFIMGSMGRIVGERIARAFELAMEKELPVVIFTASGGARMQEGILSLMQMAKTSGAAKRHSDKGLLYVTVLTDPTTGGVTASYAMLGDIILAEPKALVGFAGRRVIEQTMKQKLPSEFQTAEFVQDHGFIDRIVPREELKDALAAILTMHDKSKPAQPFQAPSGAIPVLPSVEAEVGELTPMDIVQIARKVNRPTALDFIDHIFEGFMELSGDRSFADDSAIVGGIALLGGKPVTVIGTQKGKGIEENIQRNFGQPNPEGYRKALRLMRQAEKFNRPIVTLVNTSGAYCGMGAEERGQGEAIARNLYEASALKTPFISVMTGEGGSGGALALAVADRVWALEYAVYSILSPEGFASILWKDSARAQEAADIMRMTAKDLLDLKVIEKIIPEAGGGCQNDFEYTAETLKRALIDEFNLLTGQDSDTLIEQRYQRFRRF